MLNLKELVRLRRLVNFSVDSDEPDVVKIRDKLSDMITLRKAWGKHKRIEIEREDCY